MGSGFRTFASGEVLTSSNVQNYLMDQAVMVFAGTAARASALPSPEVGMTAYSTATGLQVYNGSAWVNVSTGYGVATGGVSSSITVAGTAYTLLTFASSGTVSISTAGLFDVLICAGGGGGAQNSKDNAAFSGGGGGAGGILQGTVYLNANQTVTIGAGGAGGDSTAETQAKNGSSSSIGGANGISVAGGGIGCGWISNQTFIEAQLGGSGGGGSNHASATKYRNGAASMAPSVSGYAGGNGVASNSQGQGAGGGGGATAVGSNASTTTGGAGGAGYDVSAFIGGSALFKCGGGGGGGTTGGAGGSSVGGAGGGADTGGTSASANTGGGGGGAGYAGLTSKTGGAGGSGIVYIRFKV